MLQTTLLVTKDRHINATEDAQVYMKDGAQSIHLEPAPPQERHLPLMSSRSRGNESNRSRPCHPDGRHRTPCRFRYTAGTWKLRSGCQNPTGDANGEGARGAIGGAYASWACGKHNIQSPTLAALRSAEPKLGGFPLWKHTQPDCASPAARSDEAWSNDRPRAMETTRLLSKAVRMPPCLCSGGTSGPLMPA